MRRRGRKRKEGGEESCVKQRERVWITCERENTCELNRAGFLWVQGFCRVNVWRRLKTLSQLGLLVYIIDTELGKNSKIYVVMQGNQSK